MKITAEMNQTAAELAEASSPPKPRDANFKNLEALLKILGKLEKLRADTEDLKVKLENEIASALDTGDVLDEKLATGLSVKRGQLELVPAKLAQIQRQSEALNAEIQTEFTACFIAFEKYFIGMSGTVQQTIISFLAPLIAEDMRFALEPIVATQIWPSTLLARKASGIVGRIRFHMNQGDWPQAARELLNQERQAQAIIAAANAFVSTGAKASALLEELSKSLESLLKKTA
ncbi:MAG TPA: hypothetical protein VGY98_00650 [Verrucomicrobiae bacterium]|nr:hypothetical protein [Verrucomicrobiae bacterium]